MSVFRPRNWLDRVFAVGIVAKGLNGAAELVGGLLLLFVTPQRIGQLAASWTHEELSEDPHDLIATHLLHTAHGLTGHAVLSSRSSISPKPAGSADSRSIISPSQLVQISRQPANVVLAVCCRCRRNHRRLWSPSG